MKRSSIILNMLLSRSLALFDPCEPGSISKFRRVTKQKTPYLELIRLAEKQKVIAIFSLGQCLEKWSVKGIEKNCSINLSKNIAFI